MAAEEQAPAGPETEFIWRERFREAVVRVGAWKGPAVRSQDQLLLYGLYKQALVGDCRSQRPGLFDPTGRAKWAAWNGFEGLGALEAMQRYDRVASTVCPPPPPTHARAAPTVRESPNMGDSSAVQGDVTRSEKSSTGLAAETSGDVIGNSATAPVDDDPEAEGMNTVKSRHTGIQSRGGIRNTGSASHYRNDRREGDRPREARRDSYSPKDGDVGLEARDGCSTRRPRDDRMFGSSQDGSRQSGNRRKIELFWSLGNAGAFASSAVIAMIVAGMLVMMGALFFAHREEHNRRTNSSNVYGLIWSWTMWWLAVLVLPLLIVGLIGGVVWCAVRVARWREEIMAFSPIIPEALVRANLLEKYAAHHASGGAIFRSGVEDERVLDETMDDPVGRLFSAGTEAGCAFCAGRDGKRKRAGSMKLSQRASTVADDDDHDHNYHDADGGEVVFLTGVTGLVGQMVLYDLLRLGAAVRSPAATAKEREDRESFQGESCNSCDIATDRGGGENRENQNGGRLKTVLVMIRKGHKGASAADRLQALKESPMFQDLTESGAWADDDQKAAVGVGPRRGATVAVVEGDLLKGGLGITAESRSILARAGVTRALHCAASVRFDDPLADAAATNVAGALKVAALVASWPTCRTLVHVSTAFVHGRNAGTPGSPLPQRLPDLGGWDPRNLFLSAQNTSSTPAKPQHKSDGRGKMTGGKKAMNAMSDLGYPNTYAFTKAIGEHLLSRAVRAHNLRVEKRWVSSRTAACMDETVGGTQEGEEQETDGMRQGMGPCRLRLSILRPSIVGPSWVFPWTGWTGEQPSTVTGCLVLLLQRVVKTFRLGSHPAPVIPVDVVSRAIVHSALGWGAGVNSDSSSCASFSPESAAQNGGEVGKQDENAAVKASSDESRAIAQSATRTEGGISLSPSFMLETDESKIFVEQTGAVGRIEHKQGEGLLDMRKDDDDDNIMPANQELSSGTSASSIAFPSPGVVTSQKAAQTAATVGERGQGDGRTRTSVHNCGSTDSSNLKSDMIASEDVVIRNLAWATSPFYHSAVCSSVPSARVEGVGSSGAEEGTSRRGAPAVPGSAHVEEGRMPSFREFSGLFYDYAVIRGLRPSIEALAVRTALAVASVSTGGSSSGYTELCNHDYDYDYGYGFHCGGGGIAGYGGVEHCSRKQETTRPNSNVSSRSFWSLHMLLDRPPVWALRCIALITKRLPLGSGGRRREAHGGSLHAAPSIGVGRTIRSNVVSLEVKEGSFSSDGHSCGAPPTGSVSAAQFADGLAPLPTPAGLLKGQAKAAAETNPAFLAGAGSDSSSIAGQEGEGRRLTSEDQLGEQSSMSPSVGEGEGIELELRTAGRGDTLVVARTKRGRSRLEVAAHRLDRLTALPAVYEPFTCRPYFFESALRVPRSLTPAGYALETAVASELLQRGRPGGAEAGAKASRQRRFSLLGELGLQIERHGEGGLRCGSNSVFDGHNPEDIRTPNPPIQAKPLTTDAGENGQNSTEETSSPRLQSIFSSSKGRLALLSRRTDRLPPWPALAWWAATLPGSSARGGVTLWVRVVAFCVRAVLSRAFSCVAVDVDSFAAASPPGYKSEPAARGEGSACDSAGVVRIEGRTGSGVRGQGRFSGKRNRGEFKEDGMLMVDGTVDRVAIEGGNTLNERDATDDQHGSASREVADTQANTDVRDNLEDRVETLGLHSEESEVNRARSGGVQRWEGAEEPGGSSNGDIVVVLVPTHRSYLDFVLVSLLCAVIRCSPGLSWLRVPRVAAAEGPFGGKGSPLRWLLEKLGAFFVQRGRGKADSTLQDRLKAMQGFDGGRSGDLPRQDYQRPGFNSAGGSSFGRHAHRQAVTERSVADNVRGRSGGWPGPSDDYPRERGVETFEVFLEGTRSRDRRFLPPRTGLLRALQAAREGATLWLVPVSISYERVPEQAELGEELSRAGQDSPPAGGAGLIGLFRWTMKALTGRVRLGRVFVRAGKPVALCPGGDVRAAVAEVRRQQRINTVVTPYHVRAASSYFRLPQEDVRACIEALGGTVWEECLDDDDQAKNPFEITAAAATAEQSSHQPSLSYASDVYSETARRVYAPDAPIPDGPEAWMCHMQWLHLLEFEIRRSRKANWADWLVPPPLPSTTAANTRVRRLTKAATFNAAAALTTSREGDDVVGEGDEIVIVGVEDEENSSEFLSTRQDSDAIKRVLDAVLHEFDVAEQTVSLARQALVHRGFSCPSPGHVLQTLTEAEAEASRCRRHDAPSSRAQEEYYRSEVNVGGPPQSGGPSHSGKDNNGAKPDFPCRGCSLFLAAAALSLSPHDHATSPFSTDAAVSDEGSAVDAWSRNTDECDGGGVDEVEEEGDPDDDGDGWFGVADEDTEAFGSWGFKDSGFSLAVDERGDTGEPHVVMRGLRYGICGRPLRGLLPFVREAVGVPISGKGRARRAVTPAPPAMPPSRLLKPADVGDSIVSQLREGSGLHDLAARTLGEGDRPATLMRETLLASMTAALGPDFDVKEQVSVERRDRARHGTSHGLSDIWALRSGQLPRAPDAVVWPTSEEQVSALIQWAGKEGVCLIPFGGGTSVTRALEVPPLHVEPRPVVSVDMRKMCRILSFDAANGTAHVEAGAVGRKLSAELASRGVTMGHEPDSLEFSTLGGWVATRASGMKRGRYGNIEDIVLEVRVATGRGLAWQHTDRQQGRSPSGSERPAAPFSRTSVGLDLTSAILGSEGCLGIITSVVVKVVPLPEVSEHASFFFRDFTTGVAFCRELSTISGRLGLASCRLLDNSQLRLGRAMKGDEADASESDGVMTAMKRLAPAAQLLYIRTVKGWEPKELAAVTMVFEGSRLETSLQKKEVSRVARAHGGMSGGASAGKSGYDLTFAIAYLRDFALLFDVLGESFETFVAWSTLEGLCERVRERVRREHRARGLRGHAFVTHRVTQLYPEGACVYFYLAIYAEGVRDPPGVFSELEEAARDEILSAGGSLSHHHGVGKARAGFMSRVSSPVVSELLRGMKRALDPNNVFGARNHLLAQAHSMDMDHEE